MEEGREERDFRMTELTKFWCEDAWKEKYGAIYPWSGKDAKLLKTKLQYLDQNYPFEESLGKFKDVMRSYLKDENGFYLEDRHPFSKLCSNFVRWFVSPKKEEKKPERVEVKEVVSVDLTDERIMEHIQSNLKTWARLLREKPFPDPNGETFKKAAPLVYERARRILLEMMGPKLCKQLADESYKEVKKIERDAELLRRPA